MCSYMNRVFFVVALILFSKTLSLAEDMEGARKVEEKKGAISIVLRDIDLLWIMDCGDFGTCISQELSPGSTITVLSGNESNLCKLQAGTERTLIPDPEEGDLEVVKIENLTCPPGTVNVMGIVGEVHKYEEKE